MRQSKEIVISITLTTHQILFYSINSINIKILSGIQVSLTLSCIFQMHIMKPTFSFLILYLYKTNAQTVSLLILALIFKYQFIQKDPTPRQKCTSYQQSYKLSSLSMEKIGPVKIYSKEQIQFIVMMHFCGINQRQLEDDECCGMRPNRGSSNFSKKHDSTQPTDRHSFEKEVQTSELAARHRQRQRPHLKKKVSLNKVCSKNKSCSRDSSNQNLIKNSCGRQKSVTTSPQTSTTSYNKNISNDSSQAYYAKTTFNRSNQAKHFNFIPLQKSQNQNLYGHRADGYKERIEQILIDRKLSGQVPKYYQSNIVPDQYSHPQSVASSEVHLHQISQNTSLRTNNTNTSLPKNYHPPLTSASPFHNIHTNLNRKQNTKEIRHEILEKVSENLANTIQIKREKNAIIELSNEDSQATQEIKPCLKSFTPVTLSNASSKQEAMLPPPPQFARQKKTVMSMYDSELCQSYKPHSQTPISQMREDNPQKMSESGKKIIESVIIMDFSYLQGKLRQLIQQNPKFWEQNSRLE